MCHTHSILNMLHRSYVAYAHWCIHQHINQCSCHMFMDMSHMCMCVEQHIYVEQWYDPSLICSLHYLNMTDFFKRVYSGRMRMYHLPDRLKCEYFRQYSLCWTKEIQGGGHAGLRDLHEQVNIYDIFGTPSKIVKDNLYCNHTRAADSWASSVAQASLS